jgi:YVTN family beta-propeller protein
MKGVAMTDDQSRLRGGRASGALLVLGLSVAGALAFAPGCGDDTGTGTGTTGTGGSGTGAGTTTNTGGGVTTGTGGAGGSGGGAPQACTTTQPGESRGSPIAVSPDDSIVVAVNHDTGSVTVFEVDYGDGLPTLTKSAEIPTGVGSEPSSVVIDGCSDRAYVVLRKDQQVVEIDSLKSNPALGRSVSVGSEPTGLALSPNNGTLYVANWVEGTVSVVDTGAFTVSSSVDLNQVLLDTGRLGTGLTSRPALAHPRAIAMTNDGDTDDTDETIVATEFFGQRVAPDGASGVNADVAKVGMLYTIAASDLAADSIDLPNVADTTYPDHNGAATGCYPNQIASVTVKGSKAYVTSTCASPKGPIGVFAGKNALGACTVATQAADCGAVGGVCNSNTLVCNPNPTDVKATHHPALSIVDLTASSATTTVLDAKFDDAAVASARMPLLPTDVGFLGDIAYLTAMGADAAFRLDLTGGSLVSVGSATNDFVNLRKDANDTVIKLPMGIATTHGADPFAFVVAEGSYEVLALDLGTNQAIAGGATPRVAQSSNLPTTGSAADKQLRGKRFFTTGLGRWSLSGQARGACAGCHWDGLTDNVTWYFARGPRQSTSLDGSFSSANPDTDQRIFNWTAIFDEVADFEANVRGISGGLGAIVDASNARINTATLTPPQQALQGSSKDVADKESTSAVHSNIDDWEEVEAWVKIIRSPRKPVGLVAADVAAGKTIFETAAQGNCVGCHSGDKWTVSKRFYAPGNVPNDITACTAVSNAQCLGAISWNSKLNGFPAALFPVDNASLASAFMRFGAPPGAEQIQCILRPVGTFNKSDAAVGYAELRQDMTTAAQGNAGTGRGFNPPSLLGNQTGAPFFHAGNARTLEELFDDTMFAEHHKSAITTGFNPDATAKRQLVQFILSLDESEPTVAIPAKGATGGDLCFWP